MNAFRAIKAIKSDEIDVQGFHSEPEEPEQRDPGLRLIENLITELRENAFKIYELGMAQTLERQERVDNAPHFWEKYCCKALTH